jgi:hypothetical protein
MIYDLQRIAYDASRLITSTASDALPPIKRPLVAILLSTYNGAEFLPAQLHSFLAQTHHEWKLYWRDDGSSDASIELLQRFAAELDENRCAQQMGGGRQQITRSFLGLLRSARGGTASYFAFSDQDDVWLPDKLACGVAKLAQVPTDQPALYCAQRIIVDARLQYTGQPGPLRRPPGFPGALTQNIAPGCTMMLNRTAADLILASNPPQTVWHDWWCYVVVSAAGGRIIADPHATVLYRQHTNNLIGEPNSWWQRGISALCRGPAPFMRLLRQQVSALLAKSDLFPEETLRQLDMISNGLNGGPLARIRALRLSGFVRQSPIETSLFWIWFLIG